MSRGLAADRVRGDVEVLSRAGLDLETFLVEAQASVARAVPFVAACIATHDPATVILTSSRKYGDLVGRNELDGLFSSIEYDSGEATTYRRLLADRVVAVGMHQATGGDVARSERMSRLMLPGYGYADEARLTFREGGVLWGGMALFRAPDDAPFSAAEVEFLSDLSGGFARGVRGGVLARLGGLPSSASPGPAVVVVDTDDTVASLSAGAEARLADLCWTPHMGDPMAMVTALAASARRLARGERESMPRARVRTADGTWLLLHASPLSGGPGVDGQVVITIEEARPPEIVALVVAAFGLTPRERDVTQLVLQGVDTKEIAATLHLSAYTVQDHLKSVFEKADVRSRRELIARVYFDQYVPRMGAELAPTGWFAAAAAPLDPRRCEPAGA